MSENERLLYTKTDINIIYDLTAAQPVFMIFNNSKD